MLIIIQALHLILPGELLTNYLIEDNNGDF